MIITCQWHLYFSLCLLLNQNKEEKTFFIFLSGRSLEVQCQVSKLKSMSKVIRPHVAQQTVAGCQLVDYRPHEYRKGGKHINSEKKEQRRSDFN